MVTGHSARPLPAERVGWGCEDRREDGHDVFRVGGSRPPTLSCPSGPRTTSTPVSTVPGRPCTGHKTSPSTSFHIHGSRGSRHTHADRGGRQTAPLTAERNGVPLRGRRDNPRDVMSLGCRTRPQSPDVCGTPSPGKDNRSAPLAPSRTQLGVELLRKDLGSRAPRRPPSSRVRGIGVPTPDQRYTSALGQLDVPGPSSRSGPARPSRGPQPTVRTSPKVQDSQRLGSGRHNPPGYYVRTHPP